MNRFVSWAALCAVVAIAGCATSGDNAGAGSAKGDRKIMLAVPKDGEQTISDADVQEVREGLAMIQAGKIQAAIDGPLTDVVTRFETRYGDRAGKTIFCGRMGGDSVLYGIGAANEQKGKPRDVEVLGPAWAMAYWARAYAYNEMNRYDDAKRELEKAIRLSPHDSQYKSELAYIYQMKHDFETSLTLYKESADFAELTSPDPNPLKCTALRGQGYALVELKRLDEATEAYEACLKIQPGEPKSVAELGYIKGLRAKEH